ncbi:hypothetical protein BRAS3843_3320002 [Bradyrhizobium sp. STM 3843]|nr:hypothetical protein BRAS3843_3320002 [Bradyrhizobium sp. STM 3843]
MRCSKTSSTFSSGPSSVPRLCLFLSHVPAQSLRDWNVPPPQHTPDIGRRPAKQPSINWRLDDDPKHITAGCI